MFFIELLSHASFFVIFLTIFYVTYVGFIQQKSMTNEFTDLITQSFQFLIIMFPPDIISTIVGFLNDSRTLADPMLDQLVKDETNSNEKLLTPVFIGVFLSAGLSLAFCFLYTWYIGHSVYELFYTNLISLGFVAVTDFIIVALYGNFRMMTTEFLAGMFSVKAAGGQLDCDIVDETLFEMFPVPWIQNMITQIMS